jgi:ferredoxin
MSEAPQVSVDPDLCVGSGDCARIAPTAFEVDEELGLARALEGAATTDRSKLDEAARQCPTGAIAVGEG